MASQVNDHTDVEQISGPCARRIALAAQGFSEPRPKGRVDIRHVRRVVDQVNVLQLDSVNALCRSHYLPIFSRVGPYPQEALDRLASGRQDDRGLFEYWVHKASLASLRIYPLLKWRMQIVRTHDWDGDFDPDLQLLPWAAVGGMQRIARDQPGLIDEVLATVAEYGPVSASDLRPAERRSSQEGGRMWNWHDGKIALEWLFFSGRVAISGRRPTFERLYDLTERVIPPAVLAEDAPPPEDAQRELVRIAARALGVATSQDLAGKPLGYFHLQPRQAKDRVNELVEGGELIPVHVDGVREQMYLWPESAMPSSVDARALLSPFDSLIWTRDRVLRLFNFHYRNSIYVPERQRADGYYVLPFLLGDQLVARVDLKADRKNSTLVVPVVNTEHGASHRTVASELAEELQLMASWLKLDHVKVNEDGGNLATTLSRAVHPPRAKR